MLEIYGNILRGAENGKWLYKDEYKMQRLVQMPHWKMCRNRFRHILRDWFLIIDYNNIREKIEKSIGGVLLSASSAQDGVLLKVPRPSMGRAWPGRTGYFLRIFFEKIVRVWLALHITYTKLNFFSLHISSYLSYISIIYLQKNLCQARKVVSHYTGNERYRKTWRSFFASSGFFGHQRRRQKWHIFP